MRALRTVGAAVLLFAGGIVGGALVESGAIQAQAAPQSKKQPWAIRPDGTVVFRSVIIGNENGEHFELRGKLLSGYAARNLQTFALSLSSMSSSKGMGAAMSLNASDDSGQGIVLGPQVVGFSDNNKPANAGVALLRNGLTVGDDSGTTRVVIGPTTTVYKSSGVETKSSIGTITIFDEKGDVVWQMPRS